MMQDIHGFIWYGQSYDCNFKFNACRELCQINIGFRYMEFVWSICYIPFAKKILFCKKRAKTGRKG